MALLTRELGYSLIKAVVDPELTAENLLVYRNEQAEKQLEISADDGYFHCEIRRLLHGNPAPYIDKNNCIGFEDLATLESNGTHDHLAYFAGGANRLKGVLATTISLFNRHRDLLSTNAWVDTRRLSEIQRAAIERILKRPISEGHEKRESFFESMKRTTSELLIPQGYGLAFDNKTLPPYHGRRRPDCVSFEKGNTLVELFQEDWRDTYYMYHVQVQGMTVASIDDTDGRSNDERVNEAISKLKGALSREG
ncbi:MAG: hypothetical protein KA941_12895 [Flavobacteriales bacterium]|nr:hypothetical protein [Flavobacteriales bacterium]